MKRLLTMIALFALIVSTLASCTERAETSNPPVSQPDVAESIEASASDNSAESYEDIFEHGNYSYKRLSGNIYSAYYEPDGFRLWRTDRELGSFFRGSYQGGIEAISENRFLAHGKTSNSTFRYR